jgi:hypothetical protein
MKDDSRDTLDLQVLRLLLDDPRVEPAHFDWSLVPELARRHGVMLRLASWFARSGEVPPPPLARAFARERARVGSILWIAERIEEAASRHGAAHVFLKLGQHFPDTGRDVDVLVSERAPNLDALLLDGVQVLSAERDLRARLSGRTVYRLAQCSTAIDVHHGRLGKLGEHERYAALLLSRRRQTRLGGVKCSVPSLEDQLLLVLDRLHGRSPFRLSDVHWMIATLRGGFLDWGYLVETARATGLVAALDCCLTYLEQIHRRLFDRPLLDGAIRSLLGRHRWGSVDLCEHGYRFPAAAVTGRLYARELVADLAAGDWRAVARRFLLPVAACAAGWERVTRHATAGAGGT